MSFLEEAHPPYIIDSLGYKVDGEGSIALAPATRRPPPPTPLKAGTTVRRERAPSAICPRRAQPPRTSFQPPNERGASLGLAVRWRGRSLSQTSSGVETRRARAASGAEARGARKTAKTVPSNGARPAFTFLCLYLCFF
jgi:hypothetical protein